MSALAKNCKRDCTAEELKVQVLEMTNDHDEAVRERCIHHARKMTNVFYETFSCITVVLTVTPTYFELALPQFRKTETIHFEVAPKHASA